MEFPLFSQPHVSSSGSFSRFLIPAVFVESVSLTVIALRAATVTPPHLRCQYLVAHRYHHSQHRRSMVSISDRTKRTIKVSPHQLEVSGRKHRFRKRPALVLDLTCLYVSCQDKGSGPCTHMLCCGFPAVYLLIRWDLVIVVREMKQRIVEDQGLFKLLCRQNLQM